MEINDFMQDAIRLAKWFNRNGKFDYDDLYSAATFGAVQGLRWVAEGRCKHENIRAYVLVTMKRFIREFIQQDHLIIVPIKKVRAYRKAGEDHKIPLIMSQSQKHYSSGGSSKGDISDDLASWTHVTHDPINLVVVKCRATENMEFAELCATANINDFEKEVIRLKLSGRGLVEIGKEMGISHMTIKRALDSIKTKLMGWYHAHKNNTE